MSIKAKFRAETRETVEKNGEKFSEEVFEKAYQKARRWAAAAYGSPDMEAYADEVGYSLYWYYTEEAPKNKSFNRAAFSGGGPS